MRVAAPGGREPRVARRACDVRPFEPGHDEGAWLEVNNRAFAGHAEQGGWTDETLARRMAEPWFDPQLFLLAVDADGLVGFNWLKVHEAARPRPAARRDLRHRRRSRVPRAPGSGARSRSRDSHAVHERGIDVGMLFCAADNEAATASCTERSASRSTASTARTSARWRPR